MMTLLSLLLVSGTGLNLPAPSGWQLDLLGFGVLEGFDDGLLSYRLFEEDEGVDLNGDGDLLDRVHAVLAGAGTPFVTGLAGEESWVAYDPDGSPWAVISVGEASQGGTDLNGDGDTDDAILHLVDVQNGQVFNSGLSRGGLAVPPIFGSAGVVVRRDEFWESFPTGSIDANGDGDSIDRLYMGWSRLTGTAGVLSEGHLATERMLPGNQALLSAREVSFGVDLNSDGDLSDYVPAVYNFATDTLTTLALATQELFEITATGGVNIVSVVEAQQGAVDLNGDGDADDEILHLFDASTGSTFATSLSAGLIEPGQRSVFLEGGVLFLALGEDTVDLNQDGDQEDAVLFLVDMLYGQVDQLELEPAGRYRVEGQWAYITACEPAGQDMNGDGVIDRVLMVYNRATGTLVASPAPVSSPFSDAQYSSVDGPRTAYTRHEIFNGDLDGDGFIDGTVAYVFDATTGVSTLITGSVTEMAVAKDALFTRIFEFPWEDHNGDGDSDDGFVRYDDLATGVTELLCWGGANHRAFGSKSAVYTVTEGGLVDANGDGDKSDKDLLVLLRR